MTTYIGIRWATTAGAARTVEGRTYLEHGRPVLVLTAWGPGGGPRHVRIRRPDGSTTVRPFRGLRRAPANPTANERTGT
ncbi:MAG TPA: hypothetical protein VFX70_08880 [Mycobacteriales bacterium]|nr:hypothetical protein [Mycobacteriales bacterium]